MSPISHTLFAMAAHSKGHNHIPRFCVCIWNCAEAHSK